MQNDKLLPCPFCGGNLKRIKGGYEHKPNQCIASSIIFGDAFVDKWNTRKPMERIVEQLEEVSFERYGNQGMGGELVVNFDDAIEIVKGGAVLMGRLIDVDKLIEVMTEEYKKHHAGDVSASGFTIAMEMVRNQPCAYDKERVLAELEKERENCQEEMEECIFKGLPYHDSTEGKVIGIKNAIEIVRNGGKE